METNRLHQFKVLVECGNMRQAAQLLRISHGALSKSLHVLQRQLQAQLFARVGRGITITDQGKRVYERTFDVLDLIDGLGHKVKPSTSRPKFTSIGTFEVFSTYLASRFVAAVGQEVEVRFEELIPGQLETALIEKRVDFGITYNPIPRSELDYIEFSPIQMGVFCAQGSPFQKSKVQDLPFIVPSAPVIGSPTRVKGLDGWPDDLIERHIRYRVSLMETALELVRSGHGVAFLPHFVVDLHNQRMAPAYQPTSIAIPSLPKARSKVFMIKRKADPENSTQRQIARVLRSLK
jgi:DNA-binding transcriptional LysR family regulator